ncbi:hypothetical protein AA102526_2546 [Asaia lannensis NBRC 102526]|nr:hypothetical protein AA102526_2546 [Asaia lannensis NBRC 102526]
MVRSQNRDDAFNMPDMGKVSERYARQVVENASQKCIPDAVSSRAGAVGLPV